MTRVSLCEYCGAVISGASSHHERCLRTWKPSISSVHSVDHARPRQSALDAFMTTVMTTPTPPLSVRSDDNVSTYSARHTQQRQARPYIPPLDLSKVVPRAFHQDFIAEERKRRKIEDFTLPSPTSEDARAAWFKLLDARSLPDEASTRDSTSRPRSACRAHIGDGITMSSGRVFHRFAEPSAGTVVRESVYTRSSQNSVTGSITVMSPEDYTPAFPDRRPCDSVLATPELSDALEAFQRGNGTRQGGSVSSCNSGARGMSRVDEKAVAQSVRQSGLSATSAEFLQKEVATQADERELRNSGSRWKIRRIVRDPSSGRVILEDKQPLKVSGRFELVTTVVGKSHRHVHKIRA